MEPDLSEMVAWELRKLQAAQTVEGSLNKYGNQESSTGHGKAVVQIHVSATRM